MKAQMLTGTDPAQLPSSQASTAKEPVIDGELERLRSQLQSDSSN